MGLHSVIGSWNLKSIYGNLTFLHACNCLLFLQVCNRSVGQQFACFIWYVRLQHSAFKLLMQRWKIVVQPLCSFHLVLLSLQFAIHYLMSDIPSAYVAFLGMYVNWNFLWTLSQALKRSYQTYDELKIFLSCCWYLKQEEDDADVSKYKLDDEGDDVNDKEKRKARSESRSSSDSESGSSSDSSGSSERSRSR